MNTLFHRTTLLMLLGVLLLISSLSHGHAGQILPPGFRPLPLGAHALIGGKVIVKPGEEIDSATIVIRDGLIKAVGKELTPPDDARIWDMKGLTIYAGFIDPYLVIGATNHPVSTTDSEPNHTASLTSGGINF